jgi:hypothetical protein
VGYSQKSCTETCNDPELGGNAVCRNDIMQTIDTYDDFASVIASSILLGSPNNPPTSIAHFCGYGVNNFPFANMAAAFAYQLYVALPTPHYVVDNYCYYHPAASGVSPATCDTTFNFPPSQRVCSCAIASCVDTGAFPLPQYRRLEEAGDQEGAVMEALAVEAPAAAAAAAAVGDLQATTHTADAALEQQDNAQLLDGAALELSSVMKSALDAVETLSWEVRAAAAAAAVLVALLCARAVTGLFYAGASKAAPPERLSKIAIKDSPSKASRRSNFLRNAGPSTPTSTQLHIDAPISVSPVM